MAVLVSAPPCVIHEDEHILVVHKAAGLNTHAPGPYAGEGIYEWLRNREPRWSQLAIIHRLDKTTSGLMVFAKSKLANRSLTDQFAAHKIHKRYLFLTPYAPAEKSFTVRNSLSRVGDKYAAVAHGEFAETAFTYLGPLNGFYLLAAEPRTGRTHQIRVHAELKGLSILGDTVYGGQPFARVCLHAEELGFDHPGSGKPIRFTEQPDFFLWPALALRRLTIDERDTSAFRLIHGASDRSSFYLERWGEYLLAQSYALSDKDQLQTLGVRCRGAYSKLLNRHVARTALKESAPQLVFGSTAPASFFIKENGVNFEVSFEHGYSVGLFLDQRDNRRRLLTNYVAKDFPIFPNGLAGRPVLNMFAYTCGFSVCAALAGAHTTSVDLSKKYLEWGRQNFRVNNLNPEEHNFIHGDSFDWAQRMRKKDRRFDIIILDPPTFSRAKDRVFQAERHYEELTMVVLPLLGPGGVLFASTNAHKLTPPDFLSRLEKSIQDAGRRILQTHYVPQPIDFPISKDEPAYLKTVWFRIQ